MLRTSALIGIMLITPLAAEAATSTLVLPDAPKDEGETVQIEWHPSTSGTYRITVERIDQEGAALGGESKMFVINELPEPEVQGTSTVESSDGIKESIAKISPQVAGAATPVFSTIDSLRQSGVEALSKGEAWAKAKTEGGSSGDGQDSGEAASGLVGLVATPLLYAFSALKWFLSSAGVFYPVLGVAFLYLLWRVIKRFRRPRY